MHIEIGIIEPARLLAANVVAAGVLATQAKSFVERPADLVKAGLAGAVFSVLMQAWHLPVGPSELHLIGATTIYVLFGLAPTLLGFALGLVFQAVVFEPRDMLHLGVNALSLMLPMLVVHYSFGWRLFDQATQERFNLARVLRLDAVYYAGVSAMVAFWLTLSNGTVGLAEWATWALAYLPVFAVEALLTFTAVSLLARWRESTFVSRFSQLGRLRFAR